MSPSLVATWLERWAGDPTATAIVAPAEGVRWSAATFEERTRIAAQRLCAAGVGPRDRVLLSCAPSAATVVAYVAILRAGATVVPANPDYTRAELDHIEHLAAPVLRIDDSTVDLTSFPSPDTTADIDRADGDDLAMLAFTSGTTGRPKAAMLQHRHLLAGARAVVEAWDWSTEDVLLHTLPMFHMHGLGVGVHGALCAGAGLYVLPRFDPASVAQHAGGATMFFGVPTMYSRLADAGALPALSTLRLLVSGSAPLPTDLFHAIAARTGQPPLERYGMTETVMLAGNPLKGPRRAGSVGVPMPHVDIRLGDGDVVEVRGPSVFAGYLGVDPAETITADGWFATGDIGRVDDDGYWYLVGRASEMIISGGYNVYPREVEEVLRADPGVRDVAVVGRPSRDWGEAVVAVVVGDANVDRLRDLATASLAPYKRPKEYEFVDALPRNAMGKVDRARLRDLTDSAG